MDIKDYAQMMRYLTRPRDVVPDPSSMVPGPRNMYAGGQLVTPSIDGSRPGYNGKRGDYSYESGRYDKVLKKTADAAKPHFLEAIKTGDYSKIKTATRPERIKSGTKPSGGVFNEAQIRAFKKAVDNEDPYVLKFLSKEIGITPKQFKRTVESGRKTADVSKSNLIAEERIKKVELEAKLFDEISNNPNATIKSMAKKYKVPEKTIVKKSSNLLKHVYNQNVIIGKKAFGDIPLKRWLPDNFEATDKFLDNFANIDGLKRVQTENIGILLKNAYARTGQNKKYAEAMKVLADYNNFINKLPAGFKVDLDHPLSKAFLRGSGVSPDKLLYVTPVDRAFNRGFKEQLDKRYSKALLQGDETAIKNVRLLADKTGVNIGRVDGKKFDYGAKHFLEKRNFEKEYISNLKSQIKSEEKLKALQSTEKGQKIIKNVFKGGKVKAIGNVEKLLISLCPKGKASGGRIGYAAGTPTVACGRNQLQKLLFQGGGTTAERNLVQRIISGGGKMAMGMLNPKELLKLKNIVGPAALGIMAAYEAGSITDDVLRLNKPLDEALAGNWLTKAFMPFSEEFAKQKNLLQSGKLTGDQKEYALEMMKIENFIKEGKRIEDMEATRLLDDTGYGNIDGSPIVSNEDMNKAYRNLLEKFSRIKPYAYEEGITGRSLENEAAMNEYIDAQTARTGASKIFGGPQRLVNRAPRPTNMGRGPMTEKARMKLDYHIPGYTPYDKSYTPSDEEILNIYKKQGYVHPRFGQLEPGEGTKVRMGLASQGDNRSIYGSKFSEGGITGLKSKYDYKK